MSGNDLARLCGLTFLIIVSALVATRGWVAPDAKASVITPSGEIYAEHGPQTSVASRRPARPLSPVQDHTAEHLPYELFLPGAWTARKTEQLLPVLIFLHGRGESGAFDVTNAQSLPLQLLKNSSFAEQCPFIVVVPQCPWECATANKWLSETLQATTALVTKHIIPNFGGDPSRVYLAGQSMGGHGAWIYAAQQRGLFAAIAVICGYTHPDEANEIADRLRSTAICIAHAADDIVIPVAASDTMVQQFRRRANKDMLILRYEHAPGPPMPEYAHLIGHGSYELVFRERRFYDWLLQHHCLSCGPQMAKWVPLPAAIADNEP